MNSFCACLNPQSCRCHTTSHPVHQQGSGDYPLGYPQLSTSFQTRTPSRARTAMPLTLRRSPFTPRSSAQYYYTGTSAYDTTSHNFLVPSANAYVHLSPHHNIPNLALSMHSRGPEQQVSSYLPHPPVALDFHLPAPSQTRAAKRKATTTSGPKP